MAVKIVGMAGESVRKMKELTVKVETMALIVESGENVRCFVL
jgi:hypothetical protein